MLIKNAHIFTFDEKNRTFEKGYVRMEGGLISELGPMNALKEEAEECIDAEGAILFPGFICTHTHIYSTFARGMNIKGNNPKNFLEILKQLWWRLDKQLNHQDIYYSALVAAIECIKSGVTCVFDHHAGPNSLEGSLDVIEKAFEEIGMRGVLCYEVSDRDGKEIAKKGMNENKRFIEKSRKSSKDRILGTFGLHASFTLEDSTLEMASELGNHLESGFHLHVAEGVEDLLYNRMHFGKGIVERLQAFHLFGDKTILAHCIHISEEEKYLLQKVNIVHNPESNMNNGVGYCDALNFMRKGIVVGLGTDGFSADFFRAMHTCYVLHKHEKRDPGAISTAQVIKMAVHNNGKIASKYFRQPLGVLKEGAKADCILLDYNAPTPLSTYNVNDHIIFGMGNQMVRDVIIDGKVVMKNRSIVRVAEKEIFMKSKETAKALWDRMQ